MTLREMIAAYPERFYSQSWYEDEVFIDKDASLTCWVRPPEVGTMAHAAAARFSAAQLAKYWIQNNKDPIWSRYLWTCDFDHLGQRVYVGQNGKGLEIHRHLHLTDRWAVPV